MRPPRGFDLERIEERDMAPELDAAIRRMLCECYPEEAEAFSRCRCWHDLRPEYCLLYRDGDAVVGYVAVVAREIACGGTPVVVGGIQSLAVTRPWRGTGLSRMLMGQAMAEAKRRGIVFGFLFCIPELERFYGSLGWLRTDEPLAMADEAGRTVPKPEKNIGMYIELSPNTFPPGPIDLRGRDW